MNDARSSASTPQSATPRRRGCSCKKSGCLKLYCECFAANSRCGDRCQCAGCKNREHNRLEIAHAIQAIEKRTQKSFRSPSTATPPSSASLSAQPSPAAFPTDQRPPGMTGVTSRSVCACRDGICTSACACLALLGACTADCPCKGCRGLPPPDKARGCSCKKSNCLKLYCECLAAQRLCDSRCNCEGCKNRPETLATRERAVAAILERNPLAFQPKVASGSSQHLRGCNCRKSNCMKNYCECHQAGVACTSRCACHQCRNTETFVSAKKMLVFAGAERTSPDRQQPRRPGRRTTRKHVPSFDSTQQNQLLTPTQRPTALELLSRSAPPAPTGRLSRSQAAPSTPAKRPSPFEQRYHTVHARPGAEVTPTFAKRKYTKRSSSRPPFMERIEEAAAETRQPPSVQAAVDGAYAVSNAGESSLSRLGRSLLHAATAVEVAVEKKEPVSTAEKAVSSLEQPDTVSKMSGQRSDDAEGSRKQDGALSPTAAGLFCEEEYSEAVGDGSITESSQMAEDPQDVKQDAKRISLADRQRTATLGAMQERAVLQELSVWLRNMAAGAPPAS